jgi:hypothetical protein
MGESSQNEILFLIEENQTKKNGMYIEEDVERGESENVQTENSRVERNWGTNNEEKFAKTTCSKKILEKA